MADYQAQIRLGIQGLKQVQDLESSLAKSADNADRLAGTQIRLRVTGADSLGKLSDQMAAIETRAVKLAAAVSRIGSDAATINFKAKIDRASINRELDLVSRQFARRNWRLNVNDTAVKTARINVNRLRESLEELVGKKYVINVDYNYENPPSGGKAGGRPPRPSGPAPAGGGITPEEIGRRAAEAMAGGLSSKLYSEAVGDARLSARRQGLIDRFSERVQRPQSPGGINQALAQRYIKALGGSVPKGMSPQGLVTEVERLLREVDESVIDSITQRVDELKLAMRPFGRRRRLAADAARYTEPNWGELMDRMAAVTQRPRQSSRLLRRLPQRAVTTDLAGMATDQAAGAFGGADPLGARIRQLAREAGIAASPLERISEAIRAAGEWAGSAVRRLLAAGRGGGRSGLPPGGGSGGGGGGFTPFGLLPPGPPPRPPRRLDSVTMFDAGLTTSALYSTLQRTNVDERRRNLPFDPARPSERPSTILDAYVRSLIDAEEAQRSLNNDVEAARQAVQSARQAYLRAGATAALTSDQVRGTRSGMTRQRRADFNLNQRRLLDRIDELESMQAPIDVFGNYGELRDLYGQLPITQRRSRIRGLRAGRTGAARQVASEALIGGAFPLLFGQGPGTAAGGFIGGLASLFGPGAGFAGGLVGSALGQQLDTFTQNLQNLASSLKAPSEALTALETSGFRVGDSLKFQVEQLQAAGRAYDAQTLVLQEVERRLGAGGVRELNSLNAEQKRLQEQWSVLSGELQRGVLPALTEFVRLLADIAQFINNLPGVPNERQSDPAEQAKRDRAKLNQNLFQQLTDIDTYINPFARISAKNRLAAQGPSGDRQPLTPQQQYADETERINRARQLEDMQRDIQRGELDLIRRKQDIEFQIADQRRAENDYEREVADFRWSVEQRIFQLRSDAIRAESEVSQARSDVRVAEIGLEYDDKIFNAGSDAQRQILEASKGFQQQQEQSENQILRNKIEAELKIEQLRQAQIDRERQLEREKEALERRKEDLLRGRIQLERSIADYQTQVADYMRESARKVLDAWRQIATEMSAAQGAGGGSSVVGAVGSRGTDIARALQAALGLTPAQAAGVVGNLQRESGLNPRINEGGAVGLPRGVGGYGLAQWTGGRQDELIRFAGGAKAAGDLTTQIRFLVKELQTTERRALSTLRRARTPEEAAIVFDRDFERSGIKALPERTANARAVFNSLQGMAATAAPAPTFQPTADLSAPRRPVAPALSAPPSAAPLQRAGDQSTNRQIKAAQELNELLDRQAQLEEQSDFNALRRAIQGESRVGLVADELVLQEGLLEASKALTDADRRRLELGAAQQLEYQQMFETVKLANQEIARLQAAGVSPERIAALKQANTQFIEDTMTAQGLDRRVLENKELQEFNNAMSELNRQIMVAGAGLRAGLIGPLAEVYEQAMLAGYSLEQTAQLVDRAKVLQDQQLIWGNLQKDITNVSDAIASGLTQGLADIVTGARDIKDVGKEVLDAMARTFLDSAQQQLSALLQRQFASLLTANGTGGILGSLFGKGAEGIGQAGQAAALTANTSATVANTAALVGLQTVMGAQTVLGGLGGGGGGLFGGFGGLATNIITSAFTGGFGGFLAEGGPTRPGEAYIVGEEGPELFVPGVSGTVVPNRRTVQQKAAALMEADEGAVDGTIDVRYEAKTIAGERYVTEDQFRKGMARAAKQGQAMAYSGMRNNGGIRRSLAI